MLSILILNISDFTIINLVRNLSTSTYIFCMTGIAFTHHSHKCVCARLLPIHSQQKSASSKFYMKGVPFAAVGARQRYSKCLCSQMKVYSIGAVC